MLLVTAKGMPTRSPITSWFNRLSYDNGRNYYKLVTSRHSSEIIFPEGSDETKDRRVVFMFPDPQDDEDDWNRRLEKSLTTDLKNEFNASNIDIERSFVTKYFVHYPQNAINNGLPWDLQQLQ